MLPRRTAMLIYFFLLRMCVCVRNDCNLSLTSTTVNIVNYLKNNIKYKFINF